MSYQYDLDAKTYSGTRKPDPHIEKIIHSNLGDAKTVLNMGAGTGSYEPLDRYVVAIEPSETMRKQRAPHLAPAVRGSAESIPYDDQSFDAAMALLTVHHWPDRVKGLQELRRVTRGKILVLTFDADAPTDFWMKDYAPEIVEVERTRYRSAKIIVEALGEKNCEVIPIPVPIDCTDGFQVAFYARPEAFLKKEIRKGQSAWGFIAPEAEERIVNAIEADLKSGKWDEKYGHLRTQAFIQCQLRLIVCFK